MAKDKVAPSDKQCATFVGVRKWVMTQTWDEMREIGIDKATNLDFKKAVRKNWDIAKKTCKEL